MAWQKASQRKAPQVTNAFHSFLRAARSCQRIKGVLEGSAYVLTYTGIFGGFASPAAINDALWIIVDEHKAFLQTSRAMTAKPEIIGLAGCNLTIRLALDVRK